MTAQRKYEVEFGAPVSDSNRHPALEKVVAAFAAGGARRADVLEVGSYEGQSALAWSE